MTLPHVHGQAFAVRAAAGIMLVATFWADSIAPAGAAVSVLYVAPILLFTIAGRFWEPGWWAVTVYGQYSFIRTVVRFELTPAG